MNNNFTLNSQMKEVEKKFPYTRSTLHSKFHIGGCSKCGYEPHDTIEDVAKKYAKDPAEVLNSLNEGLVDMQSSEISISHFTDLLQTSKKVLIVDVREEWEYNIAHIPNSILLTEMNFENILNKAKESDEVIVVCHHGMRSMNATLYLREHGIHNAKSLTGGIDAYSLHVDKSIQRY